AVIGQRDVLYLSFEKLDILHARFALVLACQGEHVIRHIETVSFAGRPDPTSGKQHINAAARAEIEDGFTGVCEQQSAGRPLPFDHAARSLSIFLFDDFSYFHWVLLISRAGRWLGAQSLYFGCSIRHKGSPGIPARSLY